MKPIVVGILVFSKNSPSTLTILVSSKRRTSLSPEPLAPLGSTAKGRRTADEITLFQPVGASIEDLAAAMLVWRKTGGAEH
jgi:ornithine cyclodeaminase/alanine dehydrogenase-like protein (mu-crystallin family)